MLAYVRAQVGKRYALGGNGPTAFDCSGLVQQAFASAGIRLPRTSMEQSLAGARMTLDALQPGDLLFWGAPGLAFHDAVYVGDGQYIAAENSRVGVVLLPLTYDRPAFARRIL